LKQDPDIEQYLLIYYFIIFNILNVLNLKKKKCIVKFLIYKIVKSKKKKNNIRVDRSVLHRIFTGGAGSIEKGKYESYGKRLEYVLRDEWLSNNEIDAYLGSVHEGSEVTIHHSDVALLLQGGAGEFANTNHTHPSRWRNINIIPTII